MQCVVILPNIRSVFNVGGIFRTSDAVGVSHIYLCGYTPTPLDRFGRKRKDFSKCALGAEETVPWSSHDNAVDVIEELKSKGYQIVAIEQSDLSHPYNQIPYAEKVALIFGNEVDGVDQLLLKEADIIAELPMLGKKESLNVGVTAGIVLYEVLG